MNLNNNEKLNEIIKGSLGIITYLFFNFIFTSVMVSFGLNIENLTQKQKIFISMFISFIVLFILILISKKKLIENFKDYKKNWKVLLKRNAKYWFCALGVMFMANLMISLIFNRLTSANDQNVRDIFNIAPIYIIFEAAILAPFTEELVFRQSIRYLCKNKYVFIILSGLIFGFMHTLASLESLSDFLYIIPYSVPGFFFAYMLYKEDNVLVPISFHTIHNSMALILLIISKLMGIM